MEAGATAGPVPNLTLAGLPQPLRYFCAFVVAAFPATALIADDFASALFFIVALMGLISIPFNRASEPWPREVKLVVFALVAFFAVAAFVYVVSDLSEPGYKRLGRYFRFLLFIPVFLILRRARIPTFALWVGVAVGAIGAGLTALDQIYTHIVFAPEDRAQGSVHPIIFGDMSLLMAALSLAGLSEFSRRHRALALLPIVAAILGLMASFLSGSRGGWIALPALAGVLVWHGWHRIARWQVIAACAAFVTLAVAAYAIPQTGVSERLHVAKAEIEDYLATGEANTSVGARLEMWRTAWIIFREHPLLGVGMGGYSREKTALIEQGIVSPAVASYLHPHNEYLAALATRGVVGFASLLLLFGITLKVFYDRYKNPRLEPTYGLAGIIVVVAFIHFCFSGDTFDRSMPISFITFMLAALTAVSPRSTSQARTRNTTLSVIVIAKNEADRIEPCLKSVAGWADEIIVLDSESTDGTADIARRYTSHVEVTDWPGFGPQKQRALERATGEWVLSIDADERVTPELREEIDLLLASASKHAAYRIPWQVMSFGKTIDFGRSGRAPLRLFKREGARFTTAQVHEHVSVGNGTIGRTCGRLIHDSHRSFAHALEKFDKYAWLWANERAKRGKRDNPLNAFLHAAWMFFGILILRLGMLDGRRGLMMATLFAQYTFNKHAALWTLQKSKNQSNNGTSP